MKVLHLGPQINAVVDNAPRSAKMEMYSRWLMVKYTELNGSRNTVKYNLENFRRVVLYGDLPAAYQGFGTPPDIA